MSNNGVVSCGAALSQKCFALLVVTAGARGQAEQGFGGALELVLRPSFTRTHERKQLVPTLETWVKMGSFLVRWPIRSEHLLRGNPR
eukprot:4268539-Amphidinium_carterae.1